MHYALCVLSIVFFGLCLSIVDITLPEAYFVHRREVRHNLKILGVLISGIVIRIILTAEYVTLLASFNYL